MIRCLRDFVGRCTCHSFAGSSFGKRLRKVLFRQEVNVIPIAIANPKGSRILDLHAIVKPNLCLTIHFQARLSASVCLPSPMRCQTIARAYDCTPVKTVLNYTFTVPILPLGTLHHPILVLNQPSKWVYSEIGAKSTCNIARMHIGYYLSDHASIFDFIRWEFITFMWDHLQLVIFRESPEYVHFISFAGDQIQIHAWSTSVQSGVHMLCAQKVRCPRVIFCSQSVKNSRTEKMQKWHIFGVPYTPFNSIVSYMTTWILNLNEDILILPIKI